MSDETTNPEPAAVTVGEPIPYQPAAAVTGESPAPAVNPLGESSANPTTGANPTTLEPVVNHDAINANNESIAEANGVAATPDHIAATGQSPLQGTTASAYASASPINQLPPTSQPTAAVVPATAVAKPATLSAIGTDDSPTEQLIDDSKSALSDAIAALKTGIDAALTGTATDIPKLTADVAPAAEAILEAETSPAVASFLKSIFGLSAPIIQPLETALDTKLVAGIAYLQAKLDAVTL